MRFLHTSDWHLGRYFHEKDLLEDQKFFLDRLLDILCAENDKGNPFSALLVSGDIYDKAVPPVGAVRLFSTFLSSVNKRLPNLEMFFISGNHDSRERLSFAKEVLENDKIHITGDAENYTKPAIVKRESEEVCVYQLPFLYPLDIKGDSSDDFLRQQEEMYRKASDDILRCHKNDFGDLPSVLLAHLFVGNSAFGASERSFIGTAQRVSADVFSGFSYGAFGHIHKAQMLDKEGRLWYSGSPLAYDFDDDPNTCVLDVNLTKEKCIVKKIMIEPLHRIATIEKGFSKLWGSCADKELIKEYANCYVRVINEDNDNPVGAMQLLKSNFPYILSFQAKLQDGETFSSAICARKDAIKSNSPDVIFEKFINDAYGVDNYGATLTGDRKALFESEKALYLRYNTKESD